MKIIIFYCFYSMKSDAKRESVADMRITFDARSYKAYAAQLIKVARKLRFGTSLMLTEQAQEAREHMLIMLRRKLTIRTKHFPKRMLKVVFSRRGAPAVMGSVEAGSFDGWHAQEFGGGVRENPATISARIAGKFTRRLKGTSKFNKGKIKSFSNLRKTPKKQPFVLKDHPSLIDGLYQFKRKKKKGRGDFPFVLLRKIGADVNIKRKPWMKPGLQRFKQQYNAQATYKKIWTNLISGR